MSQNRDNRRRAYAWALAVLDRRRQAAFDQYAADRASATSLTDQELETIQERLLETIQSRLWDRLGFANELYLTAIDLAKQVYHKRRAYAAALAVLKSANDLYKSAIDMAKGN
jgi:hypothetical protein